MYYLAALTFFVLTVSRFACSRMTITLRDEEEEEEEEEVIVVPAGTITDSSAEECDRSLSTDDDFAPDFTLFEDMGN